jgi:hypothetical protein
MPVAERAFWRRLAAAVRLGPLGMDVFVDAHEQPQTVCDTIHYGSQRHYTAFPAREM